MAAPLPTPDAVRRALSEVLARPEFRPEEVPGPLAWLADRYHALERALLHLLERVFALKGSTPVLFWLLMGALVLTAVLLGTHLVRGAMDRRRARERCSRRAKRATDGSPAEPDWAAEAERAAGEERFREAALALYQALLRRLESLGAVRFHPAKTPGDYRRELRGQAARASRFDAFLLSFEPVAFGSRAVDAPGFERLSREAREVVSE